MSGSHSNSHCLQEQRAHMSAVTPLQRIANSSIKCSQDAAQGTTLGWVRYQQEKRAHLPCRCGHVITQTHSTQVGHNKERGMKQGGCMNASRCKRWAASNREDQPTYVLCKSSHEPQAHIFSSPANSSWDSTPDSAQACKGPAPCH
jgi:hypothetical protein